MSVTKVLRSEVLKRIKAGESRYAIAKASGVLQPTLARWLDEDRDIRASTIDALADYLDLELKPKSTGRKK